MAIGKLLKDLLNDKKMTVKELSEKSGVSVNTLYGIIARDNLTIKPDIAHKLSNVLDIDISTFSNTSNANSPFMEYMKEIQKSDEKPSNMLDIFYSPGTLVTNGYKGDFSIIADCYINKLNELGKKEAVKRIEELTQIKKYTEPIGTQTENEKEV